MFFVGINNYDAFAKKSYFHWLLIKVSGSAALTDRQKRLICFLFSLFFI